MMMKKKKLTMKKRERVGGAPWRRKACSAASSFSTEWSTTILPPPPPARSAPPARRRRRRRRARYPQRPRPGVLAAPLPLRLWRAAGRARRSPGGRHGSLGPRAQPQPHDVALGPRTEHRLLPAPAPARASLRLRPRRGGRGGRARGAELAVDHGGRSEQLVQEQLSAGRRRRPRLRPCRRRRDVPRGRRRARPRVRVGGAHGARELGEACERDAACPISTG